MTEVNAPLLLEVAGKIEADPVRYSQMTWGALLVADEEEPYGYALYTGSLPAGATLCGTAHCIAGWAMVLSGWSYALEEGTAQWTNPSGVRQAVDPEREGRLLLGFPGRVESLALGRLPLLCLFGGGWTPRKGLSVPDALRAVAAGATYEDVTFESSNKPLSEVRRLANEAVAASNGVSFGNRGES